MNEVNVHKLPSTVLTVQSKHCLSISYDTGNVDGENATNGDQL